MDGATQAVVSGTTTVEDGDELAALGDLGELEAAIGAVRRLAAADPHAALLREVSVARTAVAVVQLVDRPEHVLPLLLASLDAFAAAQRTGRRRTSLSGVLATAWSDPRAADRFLAEYAHAADVDDDELAVLGLGPKLWFTVNGVPVGWRPLHGHDPGFAPRHPHRSHGDRELAAARELAACGVDAAAAAVLHLGDLGRLAPGAVFVPDLLADPMVVRRRDRSGTRLTLLSRPARLAVLAVVLTRHAPDDACRHAPAPVLPSLAGRS